VGWPATRPAELSTVFAGLFAQYASIKIITKNWETYCDTGENRFLDDAGSLDTLPKGTRVVIAGEGWEREAILT
jgi:hypothetical protein